jgi:periplasmic divalent cation tolerance protein
MSDAIVVFMTASSVDEARRIADHVIEMSLAACVQILPEIQSVYKWNGTVQREKEVLMLAKTLATQFEAFEKAVREIHSYEVPEIVAVPMAGVSEPYLGWLLANVNAGS